MPESLKPTKLRKSRRVLLLVDVINTFDFPGGEHLLANALRAARAIARLKTRLARLHVPATMQTTIMVPGTRSSAMCFECARRYLGQQARSRSCWHRVPETSPY